MRRRRLRMLWDLVFGSFYLGSCWYQIGKCGGGERIQARVLRLEKDIVRSAGFDSSR